MLLRSGPSCIDACSVINDVDVSVEFDSHSDLVRITAELGNISLDPCQEENFYRIPESPIVGL